MRIAIGNDHAATALKFEIMEYTNKYLPEDIRVTSIEEVDMRFHSRLNAVSKTYEYTIATEKPDVFIIKTVPFEKL